MNAVTKFFASLLAFLQLFFSGVSYGDLVEKPDEEKAETEIVNEIDSQTNMADSIKYANQVKNQAQAKYTDAERSAYEM